MSLSGVQQLARRRSRRSAFADVHATRAILQLAIEQASAILTPRQTHAPQLFCDGQPMAAIVARLGLRSRHHLWGAYRRPAIEAVAREFLALARAVFCPNYGRISVPLFLEGRNGLQTGLKAVTGLGWLARGACHPGSSKESLTTQKTLNIRQG
ncbi:MAG: hypothetical protein OXG65_06665 [Chloroflexi bacterium]|nr:hypothetical protein [Chloroflexota bacterium]